MSPKWSHFSWAHLAFAKRCSHECCLTADLNKNLIMPGWVSVNRFSLFQLNYCKSVKRTPTSVLLRESLPMQPSLPSALKGFTAAVGLLLSVAWESGWSLLLFHVCSSELCSASSVLRAGRRLDGATAVTAENAFERGRCYWGVQRSCWQPFCGSACAGGGSLL